MLFPGCVVYFSTHSLGLSSDPLGNAEIGYCVLFQGSAALFPRTRWGLVRTPLGRQKCYTVFCFSGRRHFFHALAGA